MLVFYRPLPNCNLEVAFSPQNHLHLASARDWQGGNLQWGDFHLKMSYNFTISMVFSRNRLIGAYTWSLSGPHSTMVLIKSSALQRQIARHELESKMTAAVAEFWKTRHQSSPPSRKSIAEKHGVAVSTFKARILGRPSKNDAADARQKILRREEVLVTYLQEAARRGFPDTRKRCVQRANEIFRARTGNPTDRVSHSWLH